MEREIEIIGESVRALSDPLKEAHPEAPWRAIEAQRHVLAHDYDQVDDERIWEVATVHVPGLIEHIRKPLPPIPPDEMPA